MYPEEGVNDQVAAGQKVNSYLNEFDDYQRYEQYMKSQGQAIETAKPNEPVLSDSDRNFAALREKTEKLERENQELSRNFEYLRNSVQKPRDAEPVRKNPLDDLDLEDALPTGVFRSREQEMMDRQKAMEQEILRLNLAMKYPDYNDVVDNFAAPLIKENPNFAAGFYAAPDPYKYAYDLGAMAKGRVQNVQQAPVAPPPAVHPYAQKAIENSKKPGSLAQTGGQGSFHNVKNYATMSDEEFEAEHNRIQASL